MSARLRNEFVSKAILELLKAGHVIEVNLIVINPFSISIQSNLMAKRG